MAFIFQRLVEAKVHPQTRRGLGLGGQFIKDVLADNSVHFSPRFLPLLSPSTIITKKPGKN
jgi:hypothetical protein